MNRMLTIWMTFVLALGLGVSLQAQSRVESLLWMWTTGTHPLWDGNSVEFYGFSPGQAMPVLPGPTLVVNEGDTLHVKVHNRSQGPPHTIHWHGLDVDQANDGVPQTSFQMEHLDDSSYTFVATHAGTYLYHCHVASVVHLQLGMYGAVIVRAQGGAPTAWTGGPAYDRDYLWLGSEIDRSWHDNIPHHFTLDSLFPTFMIPEYAPDYFLVNGHSRQNLQAAGTALDAAPGEYVWLRLANMGYFSHEYIFPPALGAQAMMSDGRPLPNVITQDSFILYPGERTGVMVRALSEWTDSVIVRYRDLNTGAVWGEEAIPVRIDSTLVNQTEAIPEAFAFHTFPNPVLDVVQVSWESLNRSGGNLRLWDLQGRLLREKPVTGGVRHLSLSVGGIAPGMYLLELEVDGKLGKRRILIQ